jgi:hypothetical protein
MWYAYDYAYMILAHSAVTLMSLAGVCLDTFGSGPIPLRSPLNSQGTVPTQVLDQYQSFSASSSQLPIHDTPRHALSVDRSIAMRYCGMAMTVMVESNRSANFFPLDMAANLSLIAGGTGMNTADWTSPAAMEALRKRAAESTK